MSRHRRETRMAPGKPRCSECRKAVGDCFACQPGGMHMRLNGVIQHVHEHCVHRFNAFHAAENQAHRDARQRRHASYEARFGLRPAMRPWG